MKRKWLILVVALTPTFYWSHQWVICLCPQREDFTCKPGSPKIHQQETNCGEKKSNCPDKYLTIVYFAFPALLFNRWLCHYTAFAWAVKDPCSCLKSPSKAYSIAQHAWNEMMNLMDYFEFLWRLRKTPLRFQSSECDMKCSKIRNIFQL